MPRTFLPLQLSLPALLLGGLAPAEDRADNRPAPGAEAIRKLVARMGSEDYREREAATRKLMEIEEALPAVEEALQSPDAEVRRRASVIAAVLRPRAAERAFRQFLPEARTERLRELIRQLGAARDGPGAAQWEEVLQLARSLAARRGRILNGSESGPDLDPAALQFSKEPQEKSWRRLKAVVAGLDHDLTAVERCVLVSGGSTGHLGRVYNSIVLVDGDVAGCSSITSSLVFCRGNLGDAVAVYQSVVLVGGRFEGCTSAEGSLFQVGEFGHCSTSRDNMYVTKSEVKTTWPAENDRFFPERQAPAPPPPPAQ